MCQLSLTANKCSFPAGSQEVDDDEDDEEDEDTETEDAAEDGNSPTEDEEVKVKKLEVRLDTRV